ncbi:hypothetical protein A3759_03320 [Thalassolituus sp. HI0120]|nr:hypothetical protein A3759_03320 [Thalassolituus sp. HI0120]
MKFNFESTIACICIITGTVMLSACGSDDSHNSAGNEQPQPQRVSSTLVTSVTQQAIDSAMTDQGLIALTGQAACDVDLFQIEYSSTGVNGEPVILSGALSVPAGPGCEGPYPLLAKAHGTRTLTTYSEADPAKAIVDQALFAAHGYVVVSPDYIGLGTSDYNYHPYLHRDTEAQSMIDALRAARTVMAELEQSEQLSGKVMLAGYSQGGHTVMATQRAIEANHNEEFNLVASAPMAGPYKLENTFLEGVNPEISNIASGVLLSYTVQSYQRIYGDIYNEIADVFLPQFTDTVAEKFPGDSEVFPLILGGLFPASAEQYLQPDYMNDFLSNTQHPLRIALRNNEVLTDFIPQAPMMLCASSADGTVPFNNTSMAAEYFQTVGVTVPVIDVADLVTVPQGSDPGLSHHIYANPICFAAIKNRLFDPAK